jgi:8-oxo-dGTP pyrophosphatase MutT (NUDIX family)
MSGSFRKLAERPIWEGHVVSVSVADFESPDGELLEREIVHHPGAVVVVPVDGEEALLVRQYRAALESDLLEVPAGKRDVAGEPPEQTAHRELAEEVGMAADSMILAARFYNSPGFTDEFTHLYLATGLTDVGRDAQGIEEQHMSVERVALAEVDGLIASGEICDAKTIIGLTLARRLLKGTPGVDATR